MSQNLTVEMRFSKRLLRSAGNTILKGENTEPLYLFIYESVFIALLYSCFVVFKFQIIRCMLVVLQSCHKHVSGFLTLKCAFLLGSPILILNAECMVHTVEL